MGSTWYSSTGNGRRWEMGSDAIAAHIVSDIHIECQVLLQKAKNFRKDSWQR